MKSIREPCECCDGSGYNLRLETPLETLVRETEEEAYQSFMKGFFSE